VYEDGALVPEQISFKFHFRELVVGVEGIAESLIAIQSGLKFDCRHPAKGVMLGRVLRPASAVRPTGELAAFLVNGSSFKSNSTDTSDNKRLVRSRSIFAQRARGRALRL